MHLGRVLVVLSLALAGCAASPEPLTLEWHGSDEGLLNAQAAASEWTDVCHASIVVARGNGGVPLTETAEWRGEKADLGNTRTAPDGTISWIEVMRYGDQRSTMAHEFGHALGVHVHKSTGVMAVYDARPEGAHVATDDCALLPF